MTYSVTESSEHVVDPGGGRWEERTEPRLLLRNSVHGAPTTRGLLILGPGSTMTLGGGRAAHVLWKGIEDRLREGATASDLEAMVPSAAHGALRGLIDRLMAARLIIEADELIAVDAATGPSTRANLHAYLNAVAPAPRYALQAITAATVRLSGEAGLCRQVATKMVDFGIEATVDSGGQAIQPNGASTRLEVLFPDRTGAPVALTAAVWPGLAIVGPVTSGARSGEVVEHLGRRIDSSVLAGDNLPAPVLMKEIVGSLAVQAVVNTIAGADDYSDDQIRLVEGSRLQVTVHARPVIPSAASIRPRAAAELGLDEIEMRVTDLLSGLVATPSPWSSPQTAVAVAAAATPPPWTPTLTARDGRVGRRFIGETLEQARRNALMSSIADTLPPRPGQAWELATGRLVSGTERASWHRVAATSVDEFLRAGIVAHLLADHGLSDEPTPLGEDTGLWVARIGGVPAVADSIQALDRVRELTSSVIPDGDVSWVGSSDEIGHRLASMVPGERVVWAQIEDPELRASGVVAGWIGRLEETS